MTQYRYKVWEVARRARRVIAANAGIGSLSILIGAYILYYLEVVSGVAAILVAIPLFLVVSTIAWMHLKPIRMLSSPSALSDMPRRVAACREALALVDRREQPGMWANLQVELGLSLWRNPQGNRAWNLEEAISCYQLALEVYTREDFPADWGRTQHNLGNAHKDRIRGDRARNLEEAISCYQLALEVYTREDFPFQWAMAHNNLGNAYSDRIEKPKARNLEESISHCKLALEVYTKEDFPEQWAMVETNLAAAYWDRIRGDRALNLEEGISHCKLALEVYTREDFPFHWAMAQSNLGAAYKDRIGGDRALNLEEGISHCKLALEVRTKGDFPEQWAETHSNLASVYSDRILGDRALNLEEGISHCELALEVYTREDFPVDWARTQSNLGLDYLDRILGDKALNLEEAVSHCELALEVYTREDFPVDWARTQLNLGNAHRDRILGHKALNLEEAVSCYQLALEVCMPNTLPQYCRDTAYSLGYLLHGENRFAEARVALTTAHEAVEAMRGELQREGAKRELAEGNADLYACLVHCCLTEGEVEAGFEYAVAAKGRAFVDMLATARFDLYAAGADDPQLGDELRQRRNRRQQIDDLLARLGGEAETSLDEDGEQQSLDRSQAWTSLRSLQEQEAAHWEEMSYRYPALTATQQAPALTAEEARALAQELGATLVEYFRHADGWCAFVVTSGSVEHVSLPRADDGLVDSMRKWLQRIESSTGRGKLSYEPLRRLHRALIAPLQTHFPPGGQIVLAPFADSHLVPLGAALDPATGRYVAEDHTLTFAPSLAALRTAQQQGASYTGGQHAEDLLSVAYPDVPESDSYLPNVLPEAEAVARHFARVTPLHDEAATPEAVLSHARGQNVLHLGCHGHFDATSPQQSGLMLSGGWLTVQRIITELNLQDTRLATIGACRSGQIHVREGEEHVGLVQAMMSAGADAVVASLWRVDDAATRALLEVFYAEAASDDSLAGALADAGALLRRYPNWKHPYYWAAFQVSGLALGPYEPGLSHLSEEVVKRIETANQESMQRRGGQVMDETAIVRDSQVLLEQMGEEPEAVLDALGPAEGRKVLARLRKLSGEADRVRTEAELLELADDVHRLVEETPALADLLLEQGADSANTRTFPALDPNDPAHDETRQAAEQGILMRNHMANAAKRLERALSDEEQESR